MYKMTRRERAEHNKAVKRLARLVHLHLSANALQAFQFFCTQVQGTMVGMAAKHVLNKFENRDTEVLSIKSGDAILLNQLIRKFLNTGVDQESDLVRGLAEVNRGIAAEAESVLKSKQS